MKMYDDNLSFQAECRRYNDKPKLVTRNNGDGTTTLWYPKKVVLPSGKKGLVQGVKTIKSEEPSRVGDSAARRKQWKMDEETLSKSKKAEQKMLGTEDF